MKTIIGEVKGIFSEYGYKKDRNSFWKIENDFYKFINFQHGAYGDYLFVNVGLHPVGLPSLYTGKLEIKEKPKEHECIIRQRMEQIVPIPSLEKALTFPAHENIVQDIIFNFPKVETWLKEWGSWENIANTHFDDIEKIISVVPIIQKKAYFMLKYYCMIKLGRRFEAEKFLNAYSEENSTMDFTLVDCFLNNLLSEI